MSLDKVGFYCWAGPAIPRMTKIKYFDPQIDLVSVMGSYEIDYLKKVKQKFGVTDFWAMYSWGFNDKTESEDREFLVSKINNFKQVGMKLHAYIQGPNIITEEFPGVDWYALDEKGRKLTYYKGRKVVCINNPGFREYLIKKVRKALEYDFDGIFIDNIQMGQFGLPYSEKNPYVFAGCSCKHCQSKFESKYNNSIPLDFEKDEKLTQTYLDFRADCVIALLTEISKIIHKSGKEFGTNSFDPKFDTKYVYATDMKRLSKIQDYILFENYSLPRAGHNNQYVNDFIHSNDIQVPVFIVSYKKGIGIDSEYSQNDFDNIYSEANNSNFYPCLKGSEYVTKGVWHNLRVENYELPIVDKSGKWNRLPSDYDTRAKLLQSPIVKFFVKKYYNQAFTIYMENRVVRRLIDFFQKKFF